MLKFFRNKDDTIQMTDGQEIFQAPTFEDLQNGGTWYRKIWIESDEKATILYGLSDEGKYKATCFVSANDDDTVVDLTGGERQYAPIYISSNTETTIDYTCDEDVRIGDYIILGVEMLKVENVDNGTLTVSPAIKGGDYSGEVATNVLQREVGAGGRIPLWLKITIEAGSENKGVNPLGILAGVLK